MKKWIVLAMALIFALGLTSVVVAADEKLPVDTKATPKKVTLPPGATGPGEKIQMEEAKKPAAAKEGAVKETPMPGQGPGEKIQKEEAKKPASAKKKKVTKPTGPPASDVGGLDKMQMEEAKKPSRQDMKKKKEAAPEAPAAPEKK